MSKEVAKPYAYEYGRDNGDGTYSVVIDVRIRNAHKDWPIKELFDHPQPPAPAPLPEKVKAALETYRAHQKWLEWDSEGVKNKDPEPPYFDYDDNDHAISVLAEYAAQELERAAWL